jgi:misacylated tRNA(Ala) deacylase
LKKNIDPGMHTAEHILNGTMDQMFKCGRCFSAHIERKKSKCDYHFTRAHTAEETTEVESRVNEVISANMKITEVNITKEEAKETFNLNRLPEESSGKIRIVSVGDYDACPCIGPHVAETSEIGIFRITTSDFTDGILRVRFKLKR